MLKKVYTKSLVNHTLLSEDDQAATVNSKMKLKSIIKNINVNIIEPVTE